MRHRSSEEWIGLEACRPVRAIACSRACFGSEFFPLFPVRAMTCFVPGVLVRNLKSIWFSLQATTVVRCGTSQLQRSRELTFRIGCSRGLEKVASAVSIPGRRFTVCEFVITSVALTVAQLGGSGGWPPRHLLPFFFGLILFHMRPLPTHGPGTCACASALLVSFRAGSFQNRLFGSAALTVAQLGGSGGVPPPALVAHI